MDRDNTQRNYRLPQFDRRERERRRGEERRDPERSHLRESQMRRDELDRRQQRRQRADRRGASARRVGIVEELRQLIIRRLVRLKLYGAEDAQVCELDSEIEDRRNALKARAEQRKVRPQSSSSVESRSARSSHSP